MTHRLLVLGHQGAAVRELTVHAVGPLDEVLCGGCGALLAVGGATWQRRGEPAPGTAGATIRCAVCCAGNDACRAAA